MLGYPENGPYALSPARIGETRATISEDSYGNGPVERTIVAISGTVRSGNSGGPLVDRGGNVVGTVFAATTSGPAGGFAIPAEQVREALGRADPGRGRHRALHRLSHAGMAKSRHLRSVSSMTMEQVGSAQVREERLPAVRSARTSTMRSS